MATRTVRLDDEAEEALTLITQSTGLSISSALKQGLIALKDQIMFHEQQAPYEIYESLDLGDGGESIAPSTESKRGVQDAIRRKLNR
ncbi:MAG: hypothetical protein ETSY1_41390 [Candidatus Entotheonella factor]|uniref:Ribbon-helix-helix protein CopG domain-containing protein n=1 Tax=Entotheonella factor TaxID=1429438 RepID=W4L4D1_ENTF1|nr:hypothetical protein [Candidatus Entotheonella palauensis]ETW92953.1 MAG: hypothetical protein ETSY1_41390 [Candidatus Entotheonella factor]